MTDPITTIATLALVLFAAMLCVAALTAMGAMARIVDWLESYE